MTDDDPFTDDGFVSINDAASIGYKVVEMADRAKQMNKAVPGAVAKWSFEIDDGKFEIALRVVEKPETGAAR